MKSRKVPRKAAAKSPPSASGNQGQRPAGPSQEEIRLRAYEIYIERGRTDGEDLDDWLQAEKEFAQKRRKRRSE